MRTWMKARLDRVVVKVVEVKKEMSDVVVATVADTEWEAIQCGIVIDVGPDCSPDIQPGKTVLFSKYDGQSGPSPSTGERYVIIGEEHVWCMFDENVLDEEIADRKAERAAADAQARASLEATRREILARP